mgnify:FL=1
MNPRDRNGKEMRPGCKIRLIDNSTGYGSEQRYKKNTIFTYKEPSAMSNIPKNTTIKIKEDTRFSGFSHRFVIVNNYLSTICNDRKYN